jgi:hypothetical protein
MRKIFRYVLDALRQPLVHFVLIGAVLYAVDAWRNPPAPMVEHSVHVGEAEVTWMIANWRSQFGRLPTKTELETQVADWIAEQMRYREALALKLDVGDTIVQRRLVQKYDFLFPADTEISPADDAALQAHYLQTKEKYQTPLTFTFCHVFVDYGGNRNLAFERAQKILPKLRDARGDDPNVAALGDVFSHEVCYQNAAQVEISRDFGNFFTDTLGQIDIDTWTGPIESGLGFHLVRITNKALPYQLPFDQAREAVRADLRDARIGQARQAQFERLRQRYHPSVDPDAIEKALENAP